MSDDFYPFVDSGDPAPDNSHITAGTTASVSTEPQVETLNTAESTPVRYATRIAVYDDMLSTPRVIVIEPRDVRSYLEEVTNTVYKCMREQGGRLSLMVIREIVENFIHAHFAEPVISILDDGNTIRFADQGPGIDDKEMAFEFGVTSADREKKRYIRGTGAGFPMVQQYLENAGGAVSIEDNLGQGTVVTVTIDAGRAEEVTHAAARGAAVRSGVSHMNPAPRSEIAGAPAEPQQQWAAQATIGAAQAYPQMPAGYPQQAPAYPQQMYGQQFQGYPQQGYPQQMTAYPQQGASFPQTPYPQQAGFAAPYGQQPYPTYPYPSTPAMMPASAPTAPQVPEGPHISERGMQALAFLAQNTMAGPTELARAFGSSNATWTRELEALTKQGLVIKHGQKRILTDMGHMWVTARQQDASQQQ